MGRWRDCGDDTKRRVFLKSDAVVAAVAIGAQPFDAGDQLKNFKFRYLVIEPADFGFLEFNSSPFGGIAFGKSFYDLNHLGARRDTFLAQLEESFMRRRARFVRILKHSVLAAFG